MTKVSRAVQTGLEEKRVDTQRWRRIVVLPKKRLPTVSLTVLGESLVNGTSREGPLVREREGLTF